MTTLTTVEHAVGNTKTTARKPPVSRGWQFTFNMATATTLAQVDPETDIINALNASCVTTWCFQLEKGENGTYHYQGQMYFLGPRKMDCVRRILGRAHIEPLKDCRESIKYCTKTDHTFVRGPWAKGIQVTYRDNITITLRPFQESMITLIQSKPNDREIWWIYDEKGCAGKTTLAKYICSNIPNTIFVAGKAKDAQYAIYDMVKKGKSPKAVIFGYPRCKEAYVSYEAIENIKDGIFFNSKYESGMCIYPSPHVIVLANFKPNISQLTVDRWCLHHINEAFELC